MSHKEKTMLEAHRRAVSVLAFIVGMIEHDISEDNLDEDDDSVVLAYGTAGASGQLTLGMAKDIVYEHPCLD